VWGRGNGVGKGGEGKEREGKGREYRHFFLYTLSTANNYFNTKKFGKDLAKIKWGRIFTLKYTIEHYKQMLLAKHGAC